VSLLFLGEKQVEEFLPMGECIDAMAAVLGALARGEAQMPLRSMLRGEGSAGILGLMPAYRGGEVPIYSLKAVGVFPANPTLGLDAHQGIVALFDGETGRPSAILNASAVTAIRTAAVSALATRLLAREDSTRLAILGSGVQAASHLDAMLAVAAIESISVYSPNRARARAFVERSTAKHPQVAFELAPSARESLDGADIVVTATNSSEPVLERAWLAPGAHVNAVGASLRSHRELDVATVAAAELFTDSRESIANEAGEFQLAISEGAITGPEHVLAVIGELVNGEHQGRSGPQALTLFRSLGVAVEDLAAAELAVANARAAGAGVEVEL
jgi:ornithine cyclodeaminase/alanine dehydrogenase-like protein (mu-crystallin family)